MTELENLLNRLIEKWWKPRNSNIHSCKINTIQQIYFYWDTDIDNLEYSLRDLVSLESGLRQFVCDKELYWKLKVDSNKNRITRPILQEMITPWCKYTFWECEYNYRLMLSSIEEDIAKFLLDNITI